MAGVFPVFFRSGTRAELERGIVPGDDSLGDFDAGAVALEHGEGLQ